MNKEIQVGRVFMNVDSLCTIVATDSHDLVPVGFVAAVGAAEEDPKIYSEKEVLTGFMWFDLWLESEGLI